MPIYLCTLTNLGFENPHTHEAIANISGLDNCCAGEGHVCQCFEHRGITGYPDVPASSWVENGTHVMCRCASAPTGGVEKTPEEARAILVASFGWPETAYVDEAGDIRVPVDVTTSVMFQVV